MHISGGNTNDELTDCCNRITNTVNKYLSLIKTNSQLFEDLEPGEESTSSNGDDTCNNCPGGACNCCYDCYDNNEDMVYSDEPESDNDDYSEESDGGDVDSWRDVGHNMSDNDDVDLFSVHDEDSSHDEDMSEETSELMDAFSDLSEDTPHVENDNFDIAIEVDMSSSSSSATRNDDDDDFYEDDDNEEEDVAYEEENDDYLVGDSFDRDDEFFDGGIVISEDSESDYNDNDSRLSFHSDVSSRSRSPVAPRTATSQAPNPPSNLVAPVDSRGAQGDTAEPPQSTELPKNQETPKEKPIVEPSVSNSPPYNTDEKEDTSCCICLDGDSTHVVVPCGHICLCEMCSERLLSNQDGKKKKCPICKTKFSLIIKVYK